MWKVYDMMWTILRYNLFTKSTIAEERTSCLLEFKKRSLQKMAKKIARSVIKHREHARDHLQFYGTRATNPNARSRIDFQLVHWVRKERGKKLRPIIAKFLPYCYPKEVLFKARKLFKDKTYSVFEEMPKQLYELRKSQFKKCRMRKREVTSVL